MKLRFATYRNRVSRLEIYEYSRRVGCSFQDAIRVLTIVDGPKLEYFDEEVQKWVSIPHEIVYNDS